MIGIAVCPFAVMPKTMLATIVANKFRLMRPCAIAAGFISEIQSDGSKFSATLIGNFLACRSASELPNVATLQNWN